MIKGSTFQPFESSTLESGSLAYQGRTPEQSAQYHNSSAGFFDFQNQFNSSSDPLLYQQPYSFTNDFDNLFETSLRVPLLGPASLNDDFQAQLYDPSPPGPSNNIGSTFHASNEIPLPSDTLAESQPLVPHAQLNTTGNPTHSPSQSASSSHGFPSSLGSTLSLSNISESPRAESPQTRQRPKVQSINCQTCNKAFTHHHRLK